MKWQHAAFGLVITHKLKEELYAQLGTATPNDIEIAPMGVDIDRFCRKRPYVPWNGTGQFRIFSCGRLNACKGHDDLIRALGIIREGGIDAILSIAGADDSRGQYLRYLRELIEELRLSDCVSLLGAVSEEEVMMQLESAHVFPLASLQEPLGVAIMEAMVMEVPVLVTRAGGVAELVDDGVDGLMVLPQEPIGLAAGLRRLASDPRLAVALTKPARSKIEHFFSSHRSADVLLQLVSNRKTSIKRGDISNTA
jgi:glycosyltransferase involved in cell wall biosynthesis